MLLGERLRTALFVAICSHNIHYRGPTGGYSVFLHVKRAHSCSKAQSMGVRKVLRILTNVQKTVVWPRARPEVRGQHASTPTAHSLAKK